MALQIIEDVLASLTKDDVASNIFTSSKAPMSTFNQIWSFLLNDTPIPDGLVLTSTLFREITYNHPKLLSSFHIRLDPTFPLRPGNYSTFQIGGNVDRKAIIINNVDGIPSVTAKSTFPFHAIPSANITDSATYSQIIPFFNMFHKNLKLITMNMKCFGNGNEQKSEEKKDEIPIFPQCQLFAITTDGKWHDSITLNYKFPSLNWFNFNLEDIGKWDKNIFDKLQNFILSHEETLSIISVNLNLTQISKNLNVFNDQNPFTLKLPANTEILRLNCMNRDRAGMIRIDFSLCRHSIKQIVCLNGAFGYVKHLFSDGSGAKNLEFLVINDRRDVNELTNVMLVEYQKLFEGTKVCKVYTPCIPKLSYSNSDLSDVLVNGVECVDCFPDLEMVKDVIESHNVRKIFRSLNCQERNDWLWSLFWYDIEGKGYQKLRQLEAKWKEESSVAAF